MPALALNTPSRALIPLALFLCSTAAAAQALPDAPSSVGPASSTATSPDQPNPLLIVNGRHYRPPTQGERLHSFALSLVSPGAFAGSLYSATYRQIRERPAPEYWDTDAAGFGKRFGAAYGQRVINVGTRYTFGAILHEDNRYLICHGCTVRRKLKNALLADFTARHGADGHKTFSPTGTLSGFSGSLVAYAFWYPNQDPRFTVGRGATNAIYGFGTRPATRIFLELADSYKIPFLHRHFGDGNPKAKQQVPVGWTGTMPPRVRLNPAQPDPVGGYAEPAPAKF